MAARKIGDRRFRKEMIERRAMRIFHGKVQGRVGRGGRMSQNEAVHALAQSFREAEIQVRAYQREKNGKRESVGRHTRRQLVRADTGTEPSMLPLGRRASAGRKLTTVYVGEHPDGVWVTGYFDEQGFHAVSTRPELVAQVRDAYHGGEPKMLFHSEFVRVDDNDFDEAVRAIGPYNEFDPEKIIALKDDLPDHVWASIGRENSPAIYFKVQGGTPQELERVRRALGSMRGAPDELDMGTPTEIWADRDEAHKGEQAQKWGVSDFGTTVRAWWD